MNNDDVKVYLRILELRHILGEEDTKHNNALEILENYFDRKLGEQLKEEFPDSDDSVEETEC